MKATQKEMREELIECATALLEDTILLDCLLESMNQSGKSSETSELWEGILNRLWSYIENHADDTRYLSARLTGKITIPPA